MSTSFPSPELQTPKSTQLERPSNIFFRILLVAALVILAIWGLFSLNWARESVESERDFVDLGQGTGMYVEYPGILHADDEPRNLTFTRFNPMGLGAPLELVITLPQDIVVDAAALSAGDLVVLHMPPTTDTSQSRILQVRNARRTDGPCVITKTCFPAVLLGLAERSTAPNVKDKPLPPIRLNVETTWDNAFRTFLTSTVGQSTPLILLATAMFSAAMILLRRRWEEQDKQSEMEQKRKDEEEKRALEEKRVRTEALISDLRYALCAEEIHRAEEIVRELQSVKYAQVLDDKQLKHAIEIIRLAHSETSLENARVSDGSWDDEIAGALCYAMRQAPTLARTAWRTFEVDYAPSDRMRERFERRRAEFNPEPLQNLQWPPLPPSVREDEVRMDGPLGKQIKQLNPFPYDTAEADSKLLFGRACNVLFKHPLLQEMEKQNSIQFVGGAPGTGKTAMALALGKYMETPATLSAYFPRVPTLRQAETALTRQLLEFICYHPTFLSTLSQSERNLVAQLLVFRLSRNLVLAELGNQKPPRTAWLEHAKDGTQKQLWNDIALGQLGLLEAAVEQQAPPAALADDQWASSFLYGVHSLRLEQVRICVDDNSATAVEAIRRDLLPHLDLFASADIGVQIFSNLPAADELNRKEKIDFTELIWESAPATPNLEEFMQERFRRFAEGFTVRTQLEALFDKDDIKPLVTAADRNPRYLIQLWNEIVRQNPPTGVIGPADVERAKRNVTRRK